MIRAHKLTARPLTARKLIAYKLGQQSSSFDPLRLFSNAEEGTFLDFISPQVYADTAGTDPAEVGEGIAFTNDRSPNDVDATQATSGARPIFARVPRGGRRNLLERTEEFDNAYWEKTGCSITANAAAAPDGTTTADKIVWNSATNLKRVLAPNFTTVAGQTYTASFYAKAAGETALFYRFNLERVIFDLEAATATVIQGTAWSSPTITSVGDGWYRCSAVWTAPDTLAQFGVFRSTGNSTGNDVDGVLLWGAQFEQSASATPYQKVVTQHDITESGIPSVYNAFFDKSDDILPITLPAITGGTVALVGLSGIWIEDDWDYAGGTLNIGPTTIAGLPAGILSVVGNLCAVIINDRAWTSAERAGVVAWGKSRGAPGVFSLGAEQRGALSPSAGTITDSGGIVTYTSATTGHAFRVPAVTPVSALGEAWYLDFEIATYTGGRIQAFTGSTVVGDRSALGRSRGVGLVAGTNGLAFTAIGTTTLTLENVSVRKLELIP